MLTRPFFTTHDIADILKVNEATVRGWIKSGDLRAVDIGREWRVAQIDLEAFLNAHANRSAAQRACHAGSKQQGCTDDRA
jgi:excisionase family DNA binding protein